MESTASPTQADSNGTVIFDRLVDWAIGVILALVGLLGAGLGAALYYASDRAVVTDLFADAEYNSELLTEAEAIDALVALGQWTGLGVVVAGLLTVLVGIGVIVAHARARRAGRHTPRWIVALVGGLVGVMLGFIPFSPTIGGAVAGYLDPERTASGLGIGTLAGLIATSPMVVVGGFAAVGLFIGLPGDVLLLVLPVLAVVFLFIGALAVGLSAVGGGLGHWFQDR